MTTANNAAEVVNVDDAGTLKELRTLCEQRASTYSLLSRLYREEIDQELLDNLKTTNFPASTGSELMDEGYRKIAKFLSNTWDNTLTELAVDYVRTFIGHGLDMYSAAYPYESVYTSPERLLMQGARNEVIAIYAAYGVGKKESWHEGEDHIALELEFMQILSNRTADALAQAKEDEAVALLNVQKGFLEAHLGAWSPMLTADVRKFAKTDLYLGLASLTDGFLKADRTFLASLLPEEHDRPETETTPAGEEN